MRHHAQKTESVSAGVSRRHLGHIVRSPSHTSGASGSVFWLGCFFPHDGQNFAPSGISSLQRMHFMKKHPFRQHSPPGIIPGRTRPVL